MDKQDKFHGQGGSYEFDRATRERRRTDEPRAEPAGGGARDKDGKPIQEKRPACEPAIPAAATRAPWEGEPEAPAEKPTRKGA